MKVGQPEIQKFGAERRAKRHVNERPGTFAAATETTGGLLK